MSERATLDGSPVPAARAPKLELRNITVARGPATSERVIAARDVSLRVETGEFV